MGFEDRDYYREPEWRPGGNHGQWACRWILAATVAVFVGQMIKSWPITEWLALSSANVSRGEVWRLLTYAFCHDIKNVWHIVFNMLGLWWFGRAIEERLGSREFLGFYLTAAIFSGLAHWGLEAAFSKNISIAIGASGAIMAIMALYAMWYPRQKVLLMGVFPIEIRWLIVAFIAMDTMPIWTALSGREARAGDGIAHGAHLGGLAFGFLYQIFGLRLTGWWQKSRDRISQATRQRKNSMRIYQPESEAKGDADLDREVDDILRKIHDHGETSLTARERQMLTDASRRYRDRIGL